MVSNALSVRRGILPKPKVCKTTPPPPKPPPPPPPPPEGLLFWDQYNDVPGTPLQDHTPDYDRFGHGWVIQNGGYTIETDHAQPFAGIPIPRNIATVDVETADVKIEVWVDTGINGGFPVGGVYAFHNVGLFKMIDLWTGGLKMREIYRAGGRWHIPTTWHEPTLAPFTKFKITIWKLWNTCQCKLDDGALHGCTELQSTLSVPYGIQTHDHQTIQQDEIKIWEYTAP